MSLDVLSDLIFTDRLVLRPWDASDAEAMYALAKDPRVGPIAGWPPHTSVEDSREIIVNRLSRDGVYAVLLKETNQIIGCAGFVPREDRPSDEIEVGYWLGCPYWGYGYMHEAVLRLLLRAFCDLNYSVVWCSYYDGNTRSKNCMERCGFVYHHTEYDVPCELLGDVRTLHCMRMTKSDWLAAQSRESILLYIHGKGGSAQEAEHYQTLFPKNKVIGLDYKTDTPWETGEEIHAAIEKLYHQGKKVIIIANSIGAYYTMCAHVEYYIKSAYFISPIVDMELLIHNMMMGDHISEEELESKREITTSFGETLSWQYLTYVRNHPIRWHVPTDVLYGDRDHLMNNKVMAAFVQNQGASLTTMSGGEHWFHTQEQMAFLDTWLRSKILNHA